MSVLAAATTLDRNTLRAADETNRKPRFTMDLCPGRLGVSLDQTAVIDAASRHGFSSVEPYGASLADASDDQIVRWNDQLRASKLVWGAGGVPVLFHQDEATFQTQFKALPRVAEGYRRAGVTRTGTWISPNHAELDYLTNFHQQARRLREIGKVLGDHGLRFGLEYVGPKTLWSKSRHPFIHSMAETKQLLAEIGLDHVGFVLDSWHWYTAHETLEDLMSLRPEQVVAVDLNDAPAGLEIDQQLDNRRTLPMATGVIPVKTFLEALVAIGYDGPIRAEPFNQELEALDNEPALAATAAAMKQAFALVGG